jgi:alanine racemase
VPRPIRANLDSAALAHNLQVARGHARQARIWAVLKANAYGHGLLRVARALQDADGFAVLDLNEALSLREAGIVQPILMLEGFFAPADLDVMAMHEITSVVHNADQIRMLELAHLTRPIDVFLKMNSGMNRLGVMPDRYHAAHRSLRELTAVRGISLMTHFADADGPRGIAEQLARFTAATAALPGERSVANSPTLLRYPEATLDWVRPGIMLYGSSPFPEESADALGLRPVMTLASEVIAVQALAPGDRVGYAGTFVADRPMRIGVVACGYADGYPRQAPTGTPVIVAGSRTRLVGRVAMDMITVDLTDLPQTRVGTPVTFWGQGLPVDEVATAAGTIAYELLCALALRVPIIETAEHGA